MRQLLAPEWQSPWSTAAKTLANFSKLTFSMYHINIHLNPLQRGNGAPYNTESATSPHLWFIIDLTGDFGCKSFVFSYPIAGTGARS